MLDTLLVATLVVAFLPTSVTLERSQGKVTLSWSFFCLSLLTSLKTWLSERKVLEVSTPPEMNQSPS